jgi:type IV secretory pathway VirB10-like protein
MEHTKKFILMDPHFARPTMRDKVLSGLDSEISGILNSQESDEIKAKKYALTLRRFVNYSSPPKPSLPTPPPPPPTPITAPVPKTSSVKRVKRLKKTHLNVAKDASVFNWDDQSIRDDDSALWKRTRRAVKEKKFGTQWVTPNKKSWTLY